MLASPEIEFDTIVVQLLTSIESVNVQLMVAALDDQSGSICCCFFFIYLHQDY